MLIMVMMLRRNVAQIQRARGLIQTFYIARLAIGVIISRGARLVAQICSEAIVHAVHAIVCVALVQTVDHERVFEDVFERLGQVLLLGVLLSILDLLQVLMQLYVVLVLVEKENVLLLLLG